MHVAYITIIVLIITLKYARQEALDTLFESGRYDDKDDFTVVLQQFPREFQLPKVIR